MSGQIKGIVGWFKNSKASQDQFDQSSEQQAIAKLNASNNLFQSSQQINTIESNESQYQIDEKIDSSNLKEVQQLINKLRTKKQQLAIDKDQQARSLKYIIYLMQYHDLETLRLRHCYKRTLVEQLGIGEIIVNNTKEYRQQHVMYQNYSRNELHFLEPNQLLDQIVDQQQQLDELKKQLELKDQQILQLKNNEELQQSKSEIFKSCLQGDENSMIAQNLQENSTQTLEISQDLSYNASNSREISTQTVEQYLVNENQINTFNEMSPSKLSQNQLSDSTKKQQSSERNQFATTTNDTIKLQSKKEIQQFSNPFSDQSTNQDDSFVKENSILNISTEEIDQEIQVNAQVPKLVEVFNSQICQSSILKIDQSNFTINPSLVNAMLSQIQEQNEKNIDLKQSPYVLPENQQHNTQQGKPPNTQGQISSQDNYSKYLRQGGQLVGQQQEQNGQQLQKIDIDAQQKQLKSKQEEDSLIQQKQLEEALEKQNQMLQQKMLKQKQLTQKSLDPYRNLFPKNEIFDVFNSEQIQEGFSLIATLKQTGLNLVFKAPKVNPRYETKFLQALQIPDIAECRNQCKARLYFISEKTIYENFDEKEIYYRHDYEAINIFREMCKANKKVIFICFMVSSKTKFYFQDPEKRTLKLKSADQVYPLLLCHQKGI